MAAKRSVKKTARESSNKQAVVLIHGMGEQIPMETLRSFVDTVWVTDQGLISEERPNSDTDEAREENAVWSKPDKRNRSYELWRMTTEKAADGTRTDFYEFYWAHLMHGTTWEHLKAWLMDLLVRWPSRVPGDVKHAWRLMWAAAIGALFYMIYSALPISDIRQCLTGECDPSACNASGLCWTWVKPILSALVVIVAGFAATVLLKYFGDVARYVKADPVNVARRQEIREKGVELLETLMGLRDADKPKSDEDATEPPANKDYKRIVVVSHSLGTIVAYDILKHTFARVNLMMDAQPGRKQPQRHAMEEMLRTAIANGDELNLDAFQEQQGKCLEEMIGEGSPWIVSDFVTMGSPLTHAEFLMAYDEADLREQQDRRILPTCPPMLEWDGKTKRHHFSYRPPSVGGTKAQARVAENFRYPHHAAHFAFTRWTNLYSKSKRIWLGDIISGPLRDTFDMKAGEVRLKGVRDIAVLPQRGENSIVRGRIPFFTHTKYWNAKVRTGFRDQGKVPYHISVLRRAINLLNKPDPWA